MNCVEVNRACSCQRGLSSAQLPFRFYAIYVHHPLAKIGILGHLIGHGGGWNMEFPAGIGIAH